jgi:glyoxylase-like metal-dependent hydrolase (beta-lactamase superfamily II)
MFLSSSTIIYPGVLLLTLGETCRYVIQSEDGSLILSDPGGTAHIPALIERLQRFSLDPKAIARVIITHLDADRLAGLALLRRYAPQLRVVGSSQMASQLRASSFMEDIWNQDQAFLEKIAENLKPSADLTFSEFKESLRMDEELADGSSVQLGEETTLYCIWTPGHTSLSLSYYISPFGFAIVDETFGYYRYREVPALGADYKLDKAIASISKLTSRGVAGLGLPYRGALTGELAHRHLQALEQALKDLPKEFKAAKKRGLSRQEITHELRESVYSYTMGDSFLANSLERSLNAVMEQL